MTDNIKDGKVTVDIKEKSAEASYKGVKATVDKEHLTVQAGPGTISRNRETGVTSAEIKAAGASVKGDTAGNQKVKVGNVEYQKDGETDKRTTDVTFSRGILNAGVDATVDEHGQARINKAEIGAGKILGKGSKYETGAETKTSVEPTLTPRGVILDYEVKTKATIAGHNATDVLNKLGAHVSLPNELNQKGTLDLSDADKFAKKTHLPGYKEIKAGNARMENAINEASGEANQNIKTSGVESTSTVTYSTYKKSPPRAMEHKGAESVEGGLIALAQKQGYTKVKSEAYVNEEAHKQQYKITGIAPNTGKVEDIFITTNPKAVKGRPPDSPATKESRPGTSQEGESKPASPIHILRDKLSDANPGKEAGATPESPQIAAAKPASIKKEDNCGLLMGDDTRSSRLVALAEPGLRRPVPT
ncbi:hypothetical protein ACO0LD_23230 [Undibacterium sp. Ji83W]|uniref:hypothetical protein n=1 Tax=Undibacterium sp. Ji83W TaxID=3413043 RepID=UPI003BF03EAC